MASIYGLYDQNGALRYVGKANCPERRLKAHMRDSRRRDTPLYRWIRKNGKPAMKVLIGNSTDWAMDERRIIAECRARGEKLLNVADGGDQPKTNPDQLRRCAKTANSKRHAHIMRAFRRLESNARCAASTERGREVSKVTLEMLACLVSNARDRGILHLLDAKLAKMKLGQI